MAMAVNKLSPEKFSDEACVQVFRLGAFFHAYSATKLKPVDVVCFKTRSFVTARGDLLKRAIPEAKVCRKAEMS